MQRQLAPHENFSLEMRLLLTCEIKGTIDQEILAESVRTLAGFFPILTGRFVPTDDGCLIRIDDDQAPPLEIHHSEDFETELRFTPNWLAGPLLRVALIEGVARTTVALSLPRAFADGTSFIALHQRLWSVYTELLGGNTVKAHPIEPVLPPSLDERILNSTPQAEMDGFLAERAARIAGVRPSLLPLVARTPGDNRYSNFAVHRIELDRDRTKRFIGAAHKADLTVHGLICGVLLASVRGMLWPRTGPLVLTCMSGVNMRSRLTPPIPSDIIQSAATVSTATLVVPEASDPLSLGRQVAEILREDLAKGTHAYELAAIPQILANNSAVPSSITVTNLHHIPAPPLPAGLEATSWRILPLIPLPIPIAVVTRYDHRLGIDLPFSRDWYDDDLMSELASISSAHVYRVIGE